MLDLENNFMYYLVRSKDNIALCGMGKTIEEAEQDLLKKL